MSLVYNNGKPIGKCKSYSIEKVQGTRYFVKLQDFIPREVELNENQQIVLDWLKKEKESSGMTMFDCIYLLIYGNSKDVILQVWSELSTKEEAQVLQAFSALILSE